MLRTVRNYIDELPDITFNQFYVKYMISVQDNNIELELSRLQCKPTISVNIIDRLMSDAFERLIRK